MHAFPKKVLLAGPYVGEFGHELVDWQGYIRNLRPRYKEVHVITYPGRESLYEDCVVHAHNISLEAAGYFYGNMSSSEITAYAKAKANELHLKNFDHFHTGLLPTRFHRRLLWSQKFIRFHEPVDARGDFDIAFHFRAINKIGPDTTKNYNPNLACDLVASCMQAGWRVCCVGHPKFSLCPEGAVDFRSDHVRDAIRGFSNARVAAGELSGPIHLAMLCGTPIVTWVPGAWRLQGAYRRNPFEVPIHVVDTETTQVPAAKVMPHFQGILNK